MLGGGAEYGDGAHGQVADQNPQQIPRLRIGRELFRNGHVLQ